MARTVSDGDSGRDSRGRFAPGNRAGKGNPNYLRTQRYRQALDAALSEKDLRAVMRGLLKAARAGDVAAARLLLHYSIGRPRLEPDTALGQLELGTLATASDCADAIGAVVAALSRGEVDPGAAVQLAEVVEFQRRALESTDLERRLERLERRAGDEEVHL